MARVSTSLSFSGKAEEAFNFYKGVFGTEFAMPFQRWGDHACVPGQPPLPEGDKKLVMHVELPILGGHVLMGSDSPAAFGPPPTHGPAMQLTLEPDTRVESDKLFNGLAAGGKVVMPLQEMFWGGYYGILIDKFGVHWMLNCMSKT